MPMPARVGGNCFSYVIGITQSARKFAFATEQLERGEADSAANPVAC